MNKKAWKDRTWKIKKTSSVYIIGNKKLNNRERDNTSKDSTNTLIFSQEIMIQECASLLERIFITVC